MSENTPAAEGEPPAEPVEAANRSEFAWDFDADGLISVPEHVTQDPQQLRRQAAVILGLAGHPDLPALAKILAAATILREELPLRAEVIDTHVELAIVAAADRAAAPAGYVWRSEVMAMISSIPGVRWEDLPEDQRPPKPYAPGPWD